MNNAAGVAADKSSAAAAAAAAGAAASPAAAAAVVVVNAKSYQSRLGLARTLSRLSADLGDIKRLYIEAIDMAPNVRQFNNNFTSIDDTSVLICSITGLARSSVRLSVRPVQAPDSYVALWLSG